MDKRTKERKKKKDDEGRDGEPTQKGHSADSFGRIS